MNEMDKALIAEFNDSRDLIKIRFQNNCLWILAGFENLSNEEIEIFQEKKFNWKIIRISKTSYLCFSPTGYSWNEISLQNSDKSQNLEDLISYRKEVLPIRFLGISRETGEIFTDRDFTLDQFNTEKIISAITSQQFLTHKEKEDLDFLGDPAPLLKAMQLGEMPEILSVDLNKAEHKVSFRVNMMPPRELKEPRARWILRHFEKLWGFEKLRMFSGMLENMAYEKKEREWKHCLIPVDIFQEIEDLYHREQMEEQLTNQGFEHLIPEYIDQLPDNYFPSIYASLMFNWRYSKGIYKFDDDVLRSIYLASLPLNINPQIFTRLPEYCVYIKTPEMTDWNGKPIQGFFAMAEEVKVDEDLADLINEYYSESEEPLEKDVSLYLLIDGGRTDESIDGRTYIIRMPLDYDDLRECLEEIQLVDPRPDEYEPETSVLIEWVTPLLSQLLYLCSEEPELEHSRNQELKPTTEDVKKTKKGLKLYVPSRTNEWLCGWRTGSFIKQQKALDQEQKIRKGTDENIKTVRGHLRRAHWHTFYAGKRDASVREVRIKWLQMIKVNFANKDMDKLPTVIKKVN